MTTSMHMWIGVCLCSGREPVADPSVLHMAIIVLTIGPPASEEPRRRRCHSFGRAAQRQTVAFTFFFLFFGIQKCQSWVEDLQLAYMASLTHTIVRWFLFFLKGLLAVVIPKVLHGCHKCLACGRCQGSCWLFTFHCGWIFASIFCFNCLQSRIIDLRDQS